MLFTSLNDFLTFTQPGFAQIPYRVFILRTNSTPTPITLAHDLRRAQVALLRRGELVNTKDGELWTFSRDGVLSAPVPDENSGLQGNPFAPGN